MRTFRPFDGFGQSVYKSSNPLEVLARICAKLKPLGCAPLRIAACNITVEQEYIFGLKKFGPKLTDPDDSPSTFTMVLAAPDGSGAVFALVVGAPGGSGATFTMLLGAPDGSGATFTLFLGGAPGGSKSPLGPLKLPVRG